MRTLVRRRPPPASSSSSYSDTDSQSKSNSSSRPSRPPPPDESSYDTESFTESSGDLDDDPSCSTSTETITFVRSKPQNSPPDESSTKSASAVNAFGWVGRVDAKSRAREAGREVKWLNMSANFHQFRKRHGGLFLRRVLKGIPDSMRARSWLFLLNNKSERIEKSLATCQDGPCVDRRRVRYERWLAKVTRTNRAITEPDLIPGLAIISRDAVLRIMTAFHKGQATVPYTPAEGIFASIFLAYMDEVKAFTAFLYLLAGPKRLAKNYYDAEIVAGITQVWTVLMRLKNPGVFDAMEKLGVDHAEYIAVWLSTVFLTTQFPLPLRLRLFDRFIAYGTRAIFSFGLVLLRLLADAGELQAADRVTALLKEPTPLFKGLDWEKVLAKGDQEFVSKTVYAGLFSGATIYRIP